MYWFFRERTDIILSTARAFSSIGSVTMIIDNGLDSYFHDTDKHLHSYNDLFLLPAL